MIGRWRQLAASAVRSTLDRVHGSLHQLRDDHWPLASPALRTALASIRDVEGRLDRDALERVFDAARKTDGDIVELGPCDAQVTCLVAALVAPRQLYVVWPEVAQDPRHPVAERYVRWHRHVLRKQLVPYVVPVLRAGLGFEPALPLRIGLLITHDEVMPLSAKRTLALGDER